MNNNELNNLEVNQKIFEYLQNQISKSPDNGYFFHHLYQAIFPYVDSKGGLTFKSIISIKSRDILNNIEKIEEQKINKENNNLEQSDYKQIDITIDFDSDEILEAPVCNKDDGECESCQ